MMSPSCAAGSSTPLEHAAASTMPRPRQRYKPVKAAFGNVSFPHRVARPHLIRRGRWRSSFLSSGCQSERARVFLEILIQQGIVNIRCIKAYRDDEISTRPMKTEVTVRILKDDLV